MNSKSPNNFSVNLIAATKAAMRRAGISAPKLALKLGINYTTLYQCLSPEKRTSPSKTPRISYDIGKLFESFIKKTNSKKK